MYNAYWPDGRLYVAEPDKETRFPWHTAESIASIIGGTYRHA